MSMFGFQNNLKSDDVISTLCDIKKGFYPLC